MSTFTPYPHQEAGIEWIIQLLACALFWGMGSGKSATTLTAVDRLLNDYLEDGPVLVIAPKRVAETHGARKLRSGSTCGICGSPALWAPPNNGSTPLPPPPTCM